MRVGNVFGGVCPCVRVSVCQSVCLSVQTITFEPLHIGTSFLVWRYILTISRSSLSIKVIGSRSRSCEKNDYLLISTCYSFVWTYRPLMRSMSHIKVKVTHQGQGQIKVNIKERYSYTGGLHLNQMRSCLFILQTSSEWLAVMYSDLLRKLSGGILTCKLTASLAAAIVG